CVPPRPASARPLGARLVTTAVFAAIAALRGVAFCRLGLATSAAGTVLPWPVLTLVVAGIRLRWRVVASGAALAAARRGLVFAILASAASLVASVATAAATLVAATAAGFLVASAAPTPSALAVVVTVAAPCRLATCLLGGRGFACTEHAGEQALEESRLFGADRSRRFFGLDTDRARIQRLYRRHRR